MKTVPLHGKIAAGRVTEVDDGDYDLVMQHRWHVMEHAPAAPGRRSHGPYVVSVKYHGGRKGRRETIWMHQLITGWPRVDHQDGNGLNNQRYNLRPATKSQNGANARKNLGKSSRYKGVTWDRRRSSWAAKIMVNRQVRTLGRFANEEDAALAYDTAAREAFGEFARTNFPDEPTAAMQADWQARREAERAAVDAAGRRKISASKQEWWKERPFATHVCTICGNEFQSNWVRVALYCSRKCNDAAKRQRGRERRREGRLF